MPNHSTSSRFLNKQLVGTCFISLLKFYIAIMKLNIIRYLLEIFMTKIFFKRIIKYINNVRKWIKFELYRKKRNIKGKK